MNYPKLQGLPTGNNTYTLPPLHRERQIRRPLPDVAVVKAPYIYRFTGNIPPVGGPCFCHHRNEINLLLLCSRCFSWTNLLYRDTANKWNAQEQGKLPDYCPCIPLQPTPNAFQTACATSRANTQESTKMYMWGHARTNTHHTRATAGMRNFRPKLTGR